MPDLLTWDEVLWKSEDRPIQAWVPLAEATIRALAQKLADSLCPVCKGSNWHIDPAGMSRPCPHCGDFPPDRRGKFASDPAHALELTNE